MLYVTSLLQCPSNRDVSSHKPHHCHITIQDGSKPFLTHKRELNLPLLPKGTQTSHFIPEMSSYSLVYVVALCNAGLKVVFEEWRIGVTVTYRSTVLTEGNKCSRTGSWMVPILPLRPYLKNKQIVWATLAPT